MPAIHKQERTMIVKAEELTAQDLYQLIEGLGQRTHVKVQVVCDPRETFITFTVKISDEDGFRVV